MLSYIFRRAVFMILLLLVMSVVAFVIIQLPPGDFLTYYVQALRVSGVEMDQAIIDNLTRRYGLDLPPALRYFKWMARLVQGDFGRSLSWELPVRKLIGDRLGMTVVISLLSLVFTYVVAIPVGIYSATHQYSAGDYLITGAGFVGLATPNFLLALVILFLANRYLGLSVGGLFSPEYKNAAWSFARLWDLLKHLPIPVVVIGITGTAGVIRVMRAMLLDELSKQYVMTVRAKGVSETRLLFKYPVRIAINPLVSFIGFLFPAIVSGQIVVAIVLNLPTIGPLLFSALLTQDMQLAGTIVMFMGFLVLIGNFVSDVLLVAVEPRIRFEHQRS